MGLGWVEGKYWRCWACLFYDIADTEDLGLEQRGKEGMGERRPVENPVFVDPVNNVE